jgi:phenolic acid decarboxylase
MFLLVVVLSEKKHGQAIQLPKETWTDNTTTKRNMDRQYNDQKKHGQTMQQPSCISCPFFFWSLYCLSMLLLVVVLPVHVSFGRCIVCPCFFWSLGNTTTKRNMDRQYTDQKKHGQTIQLPKETWTDNTTTKRNMDRQCNNQKKHGQTIQVLSVDVSFGRCIVCPCFFWSLYCLSMFLLEVVLSVHVSFGRCIEHGQAIQLPKETWTDNTTTKRNMDRQYNDQKKHGQTMQRPKETWTDNRSLYCLSMLLLVVVLPVHVSFGRCIVCPCFFWSLYCLSMFPLVVVLSVHVSFGPKRKMDRKYNDQKKHGQTI